MKVAQLRTDNAKLLGSQQALNTIREQLSQENSRLSAREREMDGEWQRERERLTDQVNSMTAEAEQLREQLHVQRQQLMVRMEPMGTVWGPGFFGRSLLSVVIELVTRTDCMCTLTESCRVLPEKLTDCSCNLFEG